MRYISRLCLCLLEWIVIFYTNICERAIFVLYLQSQNKENGSHDHLTIHRGVEQLAARRAHNPEVGGSSPPPATIEEIHIGFPLFLW